MDKKHDDRSTSIRSIQGGEKQELLRFLNPFLLHEVRDKMEFLAIKKFTLPQKTKLKESLVADFKLHIEDDMWHTHDKMMLIVETICELIVALRKLKRGRSGDGCDEESSLTELDRNIQRIFGLAEQDDQDNGRSDDVEKETGEDLAADSPDVIKTSNIFQRFNIDQAMKRLPKPIVVGKPDTKPEVAAPARNNDKELTSSNRNSKVKKTADTPFISRPDHVSRKRRRAESSLKRRNCHPAGLRESSEIMLQEALERNPEIGETYKAARKLVEQDEWDTFGMSIAQKMGLLFPDEGDQIAAMVDILSKIDEWRKELNSAQSCTH